MPQDTIGPELSLHEIMQRWPNSVTVFLRHKMLCVGCPIASFHTIDDACREYNLDKSQFIDELINA
ncbi:DUF1858 domain-containing protein [Maritalea porphyrae]|uniref:DUF1858 domain-containing protein n=1 Tax=Maritalea porphyrae TaxID=880732 RepID=UPI0022AE8FA1|nr:DUF1858 domain-containing protein [Maritalea porphyrae]MCZ4272529.1 DUF1858 domain-containing protein [Maritalea porphyrae]